MRGHLKTAWKAIDGDGLPVHTQRKTHACTDAHSHQTPTSKTREPELMGGAALTSLSASASGVSGQRAAARPGGAHA